MARKNRKLDPLISAESALDLSQYQMMYNNSSALELEESPIYPQINSYFHCYRNLQGTYMTLEYLSTQYPDLVEIINIGPSYLKSTGEGGHDILALKLTNKKSPANLTKPPLFVMCGLHSRELATTEACARFAEDILDKYGKDSDKTWVLDYTEVHMIIQSNPDGREDEELQLEQQNYFYLRRKNMNTCSSCSLPCYRDDGSKYGVDLNRNFPHSQWGTVGISGPCYSSYPGTGPASEPETQAIVNYFQSVLPPGSNVADPASLAYTAEAEGVLIDVHSYGETFYWPYLHSDKIISPNDRELRILAEKFASFTTPRHRVDNEVYETSGVTTDWAHEALGVASYTFEIGTEFYEECNYFEDVVLHNTNKVLLYAAKVAKSPYSLPKGPEVENITLASSVLSESDDLVIRVHFRSTQNLAETGIKIKFVVFFIDKHPDFENATFSGILILEDSGILIEGETSIPLFGVSTGKHILYCQGYGNGIRGPVTSTFFEVVSES